MKTKPYCIKALSVALIALCFASCSFFEKKSQASDSDTEETQTTDSISPTSSQVEGRFSGYFQVVNKKYSIKKDGDNASVTIELKRMNEDYDFDKNTLRAYGKDKPSTQYNVAGFGIVYYDNDGNIMGEIEPNTFISPSHQSEQTTALLSSLGATTQISFPVPVKDGKVPVRFLITNYYDAASVDDKPIVVAGDDDKYETPGYKSPVVAEHPSHIEVNGDDVRLRVGPSLSAETLKYSNGANKHPANHSLLPCYGEEGDWWLTEYDGYRCYISKSFTIPVY